MKVVKLKALDFRGIEGEIELTPNGESVLIAGGNGLGKTSVIEALIQSLNQQYGSQLINKNASRADTEITLKDGEDEFVVSTKFEKGKKPSLTILKNGKPVSRARKALDVLVDTDLSFSPKEFILACHSAKGRREQQVILMELIGVDIEAFSSEVKDLEKRRRAVGASVKEKEAEMLGIGFGDSQLLSEEVINVSSIEADIKFAKENNSALEELKGEVTAIESAFNAKKSSKEGLLREKERLMERMKDIDSEIISIETDMGSLQEELNSKADVLQGISINDVSDKIQELADATASNKALEKRERHLGVMEQKDNLSARYSRFTDKIKALKESNRKLISEKIGELGLSFGIEFEGEKIIIDGLEIEVLNEARQMGVALELYMAKNPNLKVIRVDGFSLMSKNTKSSLLETIYKNGFQAFIEEVSDDEEMKITYI